MQPLFLKTTFRNIFKTNRVSDKYDCKASLNHLHSEFTGFSVTIQLLAARLTHRIFINNSNNNWLSAPHWRRSANDVIIAVNWSVSCLTYTPSWLLIEILKTAIATQKQERSLTRTWDFWINKYSSWQLYAQGNPAREWEIRLFHSFTVSSGYIEL